MPDTTAITKSFLPKQDVNSLGTELFRGVTVVVDWCTVRQAQQIADRGLPPDSVLNDIAREKIVSAVLSPQEARELLLAMQRPRKKEIK